MKTTWVIGIQVDLFYKYRWSLLRLLFCVDSIVIIIQTLDFDSKLRQNQLFVVNLHEPHR